MWDGTRSRGESTLGERLLTTLLAATLLLGLPVLTYHLGALTDQVVLTPGETLDLSGVVHGAGLLGSEDRGAVLLLTVNQEQLNRVQLRVARWRGVETQVLVTATGLAAGEDADAEMEEAKGDAWTVATAHTGRGRGAEVPSAGTLQAEGSSAYALGDEVPEVATEQIAGPSGGLALALAFTDALTPGVLTSGETVAATGTIDEHGNVGSVGGVELKASAAGRDGARTLLVPAVDLEAALAGAPEGVEVVPVSTFAEAVAWLCSGETRDAACTTQ